MAPEVISSPDGYGGKADVWSVACIVLEMWTGLRPWHGTPQISVILMVSNLFPPVPMALTDAPQLGQPGSRKAPPLSSNVKTTPEGMDFINQCFALFVNLFVAHCSLPNMLLSVNPKNVLQPKNLRNTRTSQRELVGPSHQVLYQEGGLIIVHLGNPNPFPLWSFITHTSFSKPSCSFPRSTIMHVQFLYPLGYLVSSDIFCIAVAQVLIEFVLYYL